MKPQTLETKIESTIDCLQVTRDVETRKQLIRRLNQFNLDYQNKTGKVYIPYHHEINHMYVC